MSEYDTVDRQIIVATQAGLPLTIRPFHTLAEQLELPVEEVMSRLQTMQNKGIIRRIGAIPNHYTLGFTANGMSVWDVPDVRVKVWGPKIGALDFVSHCYHRPRHLPHWPYCLFAMVHARTRDEAEERVQQIAQLIGDDNRGHQILYSTRMLKKTGLRLNTTTR